MAKALKVCYGDFVELVDGRKGTVKYIGRSQWQQIGGQLNTEVVFGVLLDHSSNVMNQNQFMLSLTNQAVVTLPNQISKILHEDKDLGNTHRISVNDMILYKKKYKCGVVHYIGEIEDEKDDEAVYCIQLIETDAQGQTGISSGSGMSPQASLGVFVKTLDDLVLIESNYLARIAQDMKSSQASKSNINNENDKIEPNPKNEKNETNKNNTNNTSNNNDTSSNEEKKEDDNANVNVKNEKRVYAGYGNGHMRGNSVSSGSDFDEWVALGSDNENNNNDDDDAMDDTDLPKPLTLVDRGSDSSSNSNKVKYQPANSREVNSIENDDLYDDLIFSLGPNKQQQQNKGNNNNNNNNNNINLAIVSDVPPPPPGGPPTMSITITTDEECKVEDDHTPKSKVKGKGKGKGKGNEKQKEKEKEKEETEKDLGLGVIQMPNQDLWQRQTSDGITVLKIRRQTMRNFQENSTVPIKDIITDYDSKKGGLLDASKNKNMRSMTLRRSVAGNLYDASKNLTGINQDKLHLNEINQYINNNFFGNLMKSKRKVEKEKLNITIIPDCQWIMKTDGNDSGKIIFGQLYNNNKLAVDIGTTSKLAYYDVKLLDTGDTDGTPIHLPFNANMADYYYSKEYISEYVLNPKRGTGIETHSFPHFDRPLSDDSGYFILGKRVYTDKQKEINNKAAKIARQNKQEAVDIFDLHLTAFIIPTNHWIYIPPNVIHSNDYLHGNWTTLLSWNIDINHVRIGHKLKGGHMFTWRFFHVKDETLKLRHKHATTKVPKYDSKTLKKDHIYRVKIQSLK